MIEIDAVRAETPGCEQLIHFNNAGASLMPDPVYGAMTDHLAREREQGGYEAANDARDTLNAFYDEFAALLRCDRSEIAYVENATRAWDMAFYSFALGPGDRVLTHAAEYASNYLALLQQSKRRGFAIDLAPSDATGQVDVAALETLIRPETRLIALTHVPTQGGLVNPAEAVGKVAARHQVPYLLDACQSVGQIDLDVSRIGCQLLSGTGRKFLRGPRGTGFLYVSNAIIDELEPPFIDMHSAVWTTPDAYEYAPGARRFENWESFVAGRLGLAAAVRYARTLGLGNIEQRVTALAEKLREHLASVPGVTLHDLGERRCAIVTFQLAGEAASVTASRLRRQRINVSVTNRTSAQIDFEARGLDALVRASVHYYNTEAEVERFAEAIEGGD